MNKKLIFILSLLILSSVITTSVLADNCYTFETGIPFIAKKGECKAPSGLTNMIVSLIPILFRIAGVLAFVMIVYAGFQYATSGGDTSKQKDAQDRIINAIIGLVLLFVFYLIIYTINPDILNIQELSLLPPAQPSTAPFTSTNIDLDNFIKIAKSFTDNRKIEFVSYNNIKNNPANYQNLNNYLSALKKYLGINPETNDTHGASCDMYIAVIMRATIDPNYPATWVPTQYQYLENNRNFSCFPFNSLSETRAGDILFTLDLDHTAIRLDDGIYQASNKDYYPYGPSSSWYPQGKACRYIHFAGGGSGGEAG